MNENPLDRVKLCRSNICIEARGQNAKLITGAFVFALLCIGIAALIKAT